MTSSSKEREAAVIKRLKTFPESILDYTDKEIEFLAKCDFTLRGDLDVESAKELFSVRLSGFSSLQALKREFTEIEKEDMEWFSLAHSSLGLFDLDEYTRINRIDGEEAAKAYGSKTEKAQDSLIKDYMDDQGDALLEKFPWEASNWFFDFYFMCSEWPRMKLQKLDYRLYFTLLKPLPPLQPALNWATIMGRILKEQRDIIKPRYLKNCWDNEDIRNSILKGWTFNHDVRICEYATVYSHVMRMEENRMGREVKSGQQAVTVSA